MFSIRSGILSLILFCSVSLAFSIPVSHQETIQQVYEVGGINLVTVVNENGNIDLRSGADKITLTAIRQVSAESDNAAYDILNRTGVYISKDGNNLQFKSPAPNGNRAYRVDYVLYVPADVAVNLKTVNGRVICKDRKARYTVESGETAIVTVGNKEVTASVSSDSTSSKNSDKGSEGEVSNFSKMNNALNSIIHALPSFGKLVRVTE